MLEGFSLISVDNVIVGPTMGTAPGQHIVIAAIRQQMELLPVYLPASHLDCRQLPLLSCALIGRPGAGTAGTVAA